MVEAQRARVEDALSQMLNDLDKCHLRKSQAEMHRCAAMCCDNPHSTLEDVKNCVDKCSEPLSSAHTYVQNELSHFQDRLQRCVMTCNDSVREKMSANPTDAEVRQHTRNFELCAGDCVSSHIMKIPALLDKMKKTLSGPNYQLVKR